MNDLKKRRKANYKPILDYLEELHQLLQAKFGKYDEAK